MQETLKLERVNPDTIERAFVVKGDCLMRRNIYRRTIGGVINVGEFEELSPVGDRVRFGGLIFRASHIRHYLTTGQWIHRVPKAKKTRYRAQIRINDKVLHLGYFDSALERDAAVLSFKLSNPQGDK